MNKRVKAIMDTYRVARRMWENGVGDDITVDIFLADFLATEGDKIGATTKNTRPTQELLKVILAGLRDGQESVATEKAFRKFVEETSLKQ